MLVASSDHLPLDAGAAQSKPRGIQNQSERVRLWTGLLSYLSLMQLFESVSDWWLIQISDWNIPSTDPGLGDPPWHHHIRSKPKCWRKCKWRPYTLLSHTVFSFDFWCVFQSSPQRLGDFGFQWLLLCHFAFNKLHSVYLYRFTTWIFCSCRSDVWFKCKFFLFPIHYCCCLTWKYF